jgi:hypothetical protein
MSTTTPNFSLVKPQLTDTADITAMNPNWDTIDNELKSHDDTIASLNDIINNLDASTLGALSSTLPTIADANTSIADSNPTGIKIERWSKTTLNTPYTQGLTTRSDGVVITAVIKGTFATQLSFPIGGRCLYIRHNMVGSIYAWTEYGDFKADGSVPMTGTVLNMSNGEGSIENNGIDASIRVRSVANDDSNSTSLVLDNSFSTVPSRKLYLRDTVDGENTDYKLYGEHNPPTDVCLPLNGSVAMSGNLNVKHGNNDRQIVSLENTIGGKTQLFNFNWSGANKGWTRLSTGNAGATNGVMIDLKENNKLTNSLMFGKLQAGSETWYTIFGEHNKPSGSYTGNGSDTSRTIDTGGIGGILYVWSDHCSGLITIHGAIYWSGFSGYVTNSSVKFATDGVLTISTSSNYFNANGVTYHYQVL